jgi:DNA polymerase III delta prime subunit
MPKKVFTAQQAKQVGDNERIQLEALIAHFILCGANKK